MNTDLILNMDDVMEMACKMSQELQEYVDAAEGVSSLNLWESRLPRPYWLTG